MVGNQAEGDGFMKLVVYTRYNPLYLSASTETHTISSVTGSNPRLELHIHLIIRAESQMIRIWKSFDMMWLSIENVHVSENLEWFIFFCM